VCHCKHTFGHLLSIQVCVETTPVHCIVGFGKKESPLLSDALQTRLLASLSNCKYTYGHLLSIQMCSHQTPMHWNWQNAIPTAECCSANQADSSLVSVQILPLTFALHTCVQSPNSNAPQHWFGDIASSLLSAALQTRLTAALCHCKHTLEHLLSIQVCI